MIIENLWRDLQCGLHADLKCFVPYKGKKNVLFLLFEFEILFARISLLISRQSKKKAKS